MIKSVIYDAFFVFGTPIYLTSFYSQLEEVHVFKNIRKKSAIIAILILMNWILFRAVLWESLILEKINDSLVSTNWSITTANLSGHLLGSVLLTDLTAIHPEYDTLFIEQSNVNLNFISTIFNKLTFDIIEIKGPFPYSLKNEGFQLHTCGSF